MENSLMKTAEEIKAMTLREFVFFLNSLTTTELIRQFPHRFHLLSASDSVEKSANKMVANDAILWDMVKDKAKEVSKVELYIVVSRDRSDFIFCTTDKVKAENARKEQERDEEFAGGRPSVYIKTTNLN
jgi:hypothetical protein